MNMTESRSLIKLLLKYFIPKFISSFKMISPEIYVKYAHIGTCVIYKLTNIYSLVYIQAIKK